MVVFNGIEIGIVIRRFLVNVILQFTSYFVKESRKQIVPFHPVITESFSFP